MCPSDAVVYANNNETFVRKKLEFPENVTQQILAEIQLSPPNYFFFQ